VTGMGTGLSQSGRRVLVAVVTGAVGERIGRWRERHDPQQAARLPPHTTLCYWPPVLALDEIPTLEAQVRHAFDQPVQVWLGGVREFANPDHTFYVAIEQAGALDRARRRLFDGSHVRLEGDREWIWHVTCVRYGKDRNPEALQDLRQAATELNLGTPWTVDTVAYLELRGDRYEMLAEWRVSDRQGQRQG
jgi:2'-5' RNA ligase